LIKRKLLESPLRLYFGGLMEIVQKHQQKPPSSFHFDGRFIKSLRATIWNLASIKDGVSLRLSTSVRYSIL